MDAAAEVTSGCDVLRKVGLEPLSRIGEGMEGSVYRLRQGQVAKVWKTRDRPSVAGLRDLYDNLSEVGFSFLTPRIRAIYEYGGVTVSVEDYLPGTSLDQAVAAGHITQGRARDIFFEVAYAIADGRDPRVWNGTQVFGADIPARIDGEGFGAALLRIIDQRLGQSAAIFVQHIPNFVDVVTAVRNFLASRDSKVAERVIHGDLCQPNVLVDSDGRVAAVIDWGFLTIVGDPAFEMATAAGFYDMYGPEAKVNDRYLLLEFSRRSTVPMPVLFAYRAAYCLMGANSYSLEFDGHFAWCATELNRADLQKSLRDNFL